MLTIWAREVKIKCGAIISPIYSYCDDMYFIILLDVIFINVICGFFFFVDQTSLDDHENINSPPNLFDGKHTRKIWCKVARGITLPFLIHTTVQ